MEIGAEAALFPEKEYISGIFVAVRIKIRLIEGNAKCRHLKKLPVKGPCGKCLSVYQKP
jgi:hypothetical protein